MYLKIIYTIFQIQAELAFLQASQFTHNLAQTATIY